MLRLAGQEGDGVVLNWLSPDDTARVVPLVLDGNPAADVVARLFTVTGPDREAARGLARRMVTAYLNTGVYAEYQRWLGRGPALEAMWDAWQAGDRRGALAAVPDSVIDELFLIGSPAEIRSGVADYVRAGITIPVLAVLGPDQQSVRKLSAELGRPLSTTRRRPARPCDNEVVRCPVAVPPHDAVSKPCGSPFSAFGACSVA
jgi:alkanesulfonate monooxygenase SsuD/methylene tetrahydromethanopterin reductase-like flavin-dependent oxidoreductase (luciferase family)